MKIGITCYPTYGGSGAVATELGIALAAHMPLRSAAARSAVRNIWDGARAAAEAAAASRFACGLHCWQEQ